MESTPRVEWTVEEVRLDIALRTLSTFLLAILVWALGPPSDTHLGSATNLEAARQLLKLDLGLDLLHRTRAFYLLDCLLLLSLGYLLRATLLSRAHYWPLENPGQRLRAWWYRSGPAICLFYMAVDLLENLFALGLIAQALSQSAGGASGNESGFHILRGLGALKFLLAAAAFAAAASAWWSTRPAPQNRRRRILRVLISGGFAVAAASSPFLSAWPRLGLIALPLAGFAFLLQNMWFGETRYVLRLLFFLRVPVLGKLAAALLAPLALSPLRAFLSSAYFFEASFNGYAGFLGCTVVSCALAFALSAHAGLILERGATRFEVSEMKDKQWYWLRAWFQFSALAACLLTPFAALAYSYPFFESSFFAGAALLMLGIVMATLAVAGIDLFRAWLSREPVKQLYLILPGAIRERYQTLVDRWTQKPPPSWIGKLFAGALSLTGRLRFLSGPGYFNRYGILYPDQGFALMFFLVTALIFLVLVALGVSADKAPVPALTSILFLILFLASGLGALAFYLDRYRIPLFAGLAGFLLIGVNFTPETDHRFSVQAPQSVVYKTPADLLSARGKPILIAASGGGIQAAAWLTRIASGLGEEQSVDFPRRVALLSTVSGGSVGALFLGAHWNGDLRMASSGSRISSLGAVSWAFAGPDLFRPLAAWFNVRDWDRGYALENSLRQRLPDPQAGPTLSQWAAAAGPNFPAFLINTTVAETGGPVAFATTELPSNHFQTMHPNKLTGNHVVNSWAAFTKEKCEGLKMEVSVTTAARLSATFPYVSPAARPDIEGHNCNYHFVDGGYYDNYGIIALLQWLDDALESLPPQSRPNHIGVIVIRGANLPPSVEYQPWSYLRQVSAPLESFLNMRGYAQWEGGAAALRVFTEKWNLKAPSLRLEVELLDYPDLRRIHRECAEEPLTWKLTPTEQNCVDKAFEVVKRGPAYRNILAW